MDRLEAMSLFLKSVECGSLSAAAREMHIPLTTLSRKVADLEAHLKVRLMVRSTRKLTLTEAGSTYLVAAKRILDEVQAAEQVAAGEFAVPKGELTVTAPLAFGRLHLLPVVADFLKAFPEINVKLLLGDRIFDFFEEGVDAAIRVGELPDSSLRAIRLGQFPEVLCASPEFLSREGTPKSPKELSEFACVTFQQGASSSAWSFSSDQSAVFLPVRSKLAVTTAEAAVDAAVAGVGITRVLSYQVATAVKEKRLVLILRKYESSPLPIHLIYADQGLVSVKLRAFLDFAAPRLKRGIAESLQATSLQITRQRK